MINLAKLEEVAEGDQEFLESLLTDIIRLLQEFKQDYETEMQTGEIEKVRFLTHRIKANIELVGADILYDITDAGKEILRDSPDNDGLIRKNIEALKQTVDKVVEEMKTKLS